MDLSVLDWTIILGYIVFALGVGVFFAGRAGKSSEEYYLGGRTMPWWILGTSMVATTFAADTPLAITEYIRQDGIWRNWFWWNWLLSGILGVFLFSRLWRRAGILTDNELLELRYTGKPAAFLRGYKALHFGIVFNLIVMGWVLESMSSVLAVTLGTNKESVMWWLVGIALVYSILSGFWGVVVTDLVQFAIAMVGAIALAVIAVNHVGGMDALLTKLDAIGSERKEVVSQLAEFENADGSAIELSESESAEKAALNERLKTLAPVTEQTTRFLPSPPENATTAQFLVSPFFQVLVLILFMPWNHHGTDGSGYIIQRMMSAKNEKHALMGTLWYHLANTALRVWPWIIVALVSLVLYPDLVGFKDPAGNVVGDKAGYPKVMQDLLGSGMKGLLIVSFLAAFMSTIDTHLNWGSSYLVNDVYKRFFAPNSSEKSLVLAGRVVTILLMLAAAIVSMYIGSISKAWDFVWAMGAGVGLVLILRWFWWRINAWSEITALATSFVVTVSFQIVAWLQAVADAEERLLDEVPYELFQNLPVFYGIEFAFHLQLIVIVVISLVAWITVTFLTAPVPEAQLIKFYERVQPGGLWGPLKGKVNITLKPVSRGILGNFIAGVLFIYGTTFAIGNLIFLNWVNAALLGAVALVGALWIWFFCLRRFDDPS